MSSIKRNIIRFTRGCFVSKELFFLGGGRVLNHMKQIESYYIPYFIFVLQFGLKLVIMIIEKISAINLPNLNYFILLALFFQLILYFVKKEQKFKIHQTTFLTFIIFCLVFIIELLWGFSFLISGSMYLFKYFLGFYFNQLLMIILLFYLGYNSLGIIEAISRNNTLKIVSLLIYFILVSLFIYANKYLSGSGELFYGLDISYIYLGDMFAIFSIFISIHIRNKIFRSIIMILSLIFLVQIGSRSALVFFFITFLISIVGYINSLRKLCATLFIASFLVLIFNIFNDFFLQHLPERVVRILSFRNLLNDYSFLARDKIMSSALDNIRGNLLIGSFFAEYRIRNGWGLYIHNVLSYLEEYGIIVFSLLISLISFSINILIQLQIRMKNSSFVNYCLYQSTFIILSTLFTRSYIYYYIWMVFGMIFCIQSNKKIIVSLSS